ncbi:MAG: hypothetical protein AABY00_02280 [Nanoarchaeota archaeon]
MNYKDIPYEFNFMWIRTIHGDGIGYQWTRASSKAFLGSGGGFIAKSVEQAIRFLPEVFQNFETEARVLVSNHYNILRHAQVLKEEALPLIARLHEIRPDLKVVDRLV